MTKKVKGKYYGATDTLCTSNFTYGRSAAAVKYAKLPVPLFFHAQRKAKIMPNANGELRTCWGDKHFVGDIIVQHGTVCRVAPAREEDVPPNHVPLTLGMKPPEGREFFTIPIDEIEAP